MIGSFSAFKSGALITNVPSRSSTLANHIPSPLGLPIVTLCEALSSGDVVNATTSGGLSNACRGVVDPIHRTACNVDSVFKSDCTFVWYSSPLPFGQVH